MAMTNEYQMEELEYTNLISSLPQNPHLDQYETRSAMAEHIVSTTLSTNNTRHEQYSMGLSKHSFTFVGKEENGKVKWLLVEKILKITKKPTK